MEKQTYKVPGQWRWLLGLAAALASALTIADQKQEQRAATHSGLDLVGINMSAALFAPHILPGTLGTNYFYPDKSYFAYYSSKNIRLIRFPFLWERVQHDLNKGLNFDQIRLLRRTLDYAAAHGQKIILDMHNYGRYKDQLIGSPDVPYEAYANIWRRLAETFKDHPALYGYDIMNEPHSTQGLWPGAAQAAVNAIREVDRKTPIIVEGDRWASAYHWPHYNADFLIDDPADNLIYSAHLYLDSDFSGKYEPENSKNIHPMLGVDRARPFIEWLKKHNLRGFLGEYGIPDDNEEMKVAMDNLLAYLNDNCVPSAYWSAGPGWGTYKLSLEPRDGEDRPQMKIMQKHLANSCTEIGPFPD